MRTRKRSGSSKIGGDSDGSEVGQSELIVSIDLGVPEVKVQTPTSFRVIDADLPEAVKRKSRFIIFCLAP